MTNPARFPAFNNIINESLMRNNFWYYFLNLCSRNNSNDMQTPPQEDLVWYKIKHNATTVLKWTQKYYLILAQVVER